MRGKHKSIAVKNDGQFFNEITTERKSRKGASRSSSTERKLPKETFSSSPTERKSKTCHPLLPEFLKLLRYFFQQCCRCRLSKIPQFWFYPCCLSFDITSQTLPAWQELQVKGKNAHKDALSRAITKKRIFASLA